MAKLSFILQRQSIGLLFGDLVLILLVLAILSKCDGGMFNES